MVLWNGFDVGVFIILQEFSDRHSFNQCLSEKLLRVTSKSRHTTAWLF